MTHSVCGKLRLIPVTKGQRDVSQNDCLDANTVVMVYTTASIQYDRILCIVIHSVAISVGCGGE